MAWSEVLGTLNLVRIFLVLEEGMKRGLEQGMCSSSFLCWCSFFGTRLDKGSVRWRRPRLLSFPSKEVEANWEEGLIGELEVRDLNSLHYLPLNSSLADHPYMEMSLMGGRDKGLNQVKWSSPLGILACQVCCSHGEMLWRHVGCISGP